MRLVDSRPVLLNFGIYGRDFKSSAAAAQPTNAVTLLLVLAVAGVWALNNVGVGE